MAKSINIIFVIPTGSDGSSQYYTEATEFNKFLGDMNLKEIPTKYIYSVSILFNSGVDVTLKGDEITKPIPVNNSLSKKQWGEVLSTTEPIRQIKVRIDFVKLLNDVNSIVDRLLNRNQP